MVAAQTVLGCPVMGVGLALRQPILEETLNATDLIDWVEITADNHIQRGGHSSRMLERARAVYPLVSHSFGLSLGSVEPFDMDYVRALKTLLDDINTPWFADHLCFSSALGTYAKDLIPLPMTDEAVTHVADRIKWLQDFFQRRFIFENVCYYFEYPQNEMPEHAFLSAIAEKADCGMLLDLNNVYVNAVNYGWDGVAFLRNIPMDRVVEIHMSGCMEYPECLVDVHGGPVRDEVWGLLQWVLDHGRPPGVLLERDYNIPAFDEIQRELRIIRDMWDKAQPQSLHRQTVGEAVVCHSQR